MSVALDEITFQRLREFRRRRIALATSRGWAAVVTVFIATLLLAVIIDALSVNSTMRWLASGLVYVATLGTWYWCCWHSVRTHESLHSEAKRFEEVDPRLREQLLTAVEFADDHHSRSHDSLAFKDQLQAHVAQLIAPVDVRQLLPWRMVRKWMFAATLALTILVLLGFIPQLHWMNRIARALLPAANLDRVARVAITIEAPQPNSKTIAQGDILAIVARINGPRPEGVLIESREANGATATLPMQVQAANTAAENDAVEVESKPSATRYQANLSTDQPWIEYRVTTQDAYTAWHRLTAQPRPEILRFKKTLIPPVYSQLPEVIQEGSDGNIRAWIGSRVQLAIQVSQPIAVGEIRWQSSTQLADETSKPISLTLVQDAASGLYSAEFIVNQSDSYRVHLQSAETGFVNEFSPSYALEAVTDQAPVVAWTQPTQARQIVAPDQILALAAKIQDEMPVDSLTQAARINRAGEWRTTTIDPLSPNTSGSDEKLSLPGASTATDASWQSDLLPYSLRVGDVVELKLMAEDRLGQRAESSLVELLISESTITLTPTPGEQLRQTVAAELEAFDQRIKQQAQLMQELVKPKPVAEGQTKVPPTETQLREQSERLVNAANNLVHSIQEDAPKLLVMIEQTAAQLEDSASLLELEQAGQALSILKIKNANELLAVAQRLTEADNKLTAKQRTEMEKVVVEQTQGLEQTSHALAEVFRTMVSHDVGRRLSQQVAKMEQLFDGFGDSFAGSERPQDAEQQRRQGVVLSRQLMELQQAMLDSMPGVRQDTKPRLTQAADAISNLVNQLNTVGANADIVELKKQAEQVERNLSQWKNTSWFDGGLHDAIIAGHRRLSEFGGQPADQLRRASANLTKPEGNTGVEVTSATTEAVVENLNDRRSLLRARQAGDREFASDLGNAARAIREITQDDSVSKLDQQQSLQATATALETLQAVHGVNEATAILDDLLSGERWSLNTSAAITNHPILFDSFAERLENAVKLLRQGKVPNELTDSVERLRWHDATGKAGQKINSRRWENSPAVSAAAELNQLSEQLAAAQRTLEPLAQQARAKLAEQAPSLGDLARAASGATRDLQQQTQALATAIERHEVPDEVTPLAQLASQQQQVAAPIAELRDALVDHADSQNLLREQQLVSAREADAALSVVDAAQSEIDASLQATASPRESAEQAQALDAAADQQASAAEKLDKLAEHFEAASQPTNAATQPKDVSPSLMQLANELGASAEAQQRYDEAAQLARLAAARPEEVLRQLEQKLAKSPPMQQEMSRISQELAEQALNRLDRAANQQQKMQPVMEASDPRFHAQKKLLLQDLQTARESTNHLLGSLVSEAKWTSGAGRDEASQKQLEATESELRAALTAAEKTNLDKTFGDLRSAADTLAKSLQAANQVLRSTAQTLTDASGREVHQNDADLANRRREMQDRQRRIAQQEVRNLEQAERHQQQLLRQAENEFKQTEQREKSLEQHLTNIQKEADKHPENASLKQQVVDALRNLGYGRAYTQAADQTKQQLAQRVEFATQNRAAASTHLPADLTSVNPSAQLAAELARLAAERSAQLAKQLAPWQAAPASELKPEANVSQLQNSTQEERGVEQAVQDSADDLARASRHEQRLNNQPSSQQLSVQATDTQNLNQQEVHRAEQALNSALENSKRPEAVTGQATAASTQAALNTMQAADAAIRGRADQLRTLLGAQKTQTKSSKSPATTDAESEAALLNSQQLAQLLDEVDRQLNPGQPDRTALGQPAATASGQQTPGTLASAAAQISSQLSRSRQPSTQPNSNQAKATESNSANVDPQAAVAVKVLDVNRVGGDWGKLRERAAEDMLESQRESVAPAYRQQIEAYFRSLAERGQPGL